MFQSDVYQYDRWLARGFSGAMEYLTRGRDRRANPALVFPGAKSVFCVAMPYSAASEERTGVRYARYLRGRDYHVEISEKLERVMGRVNSSWFQYERPPLKWKVCVDTSAVLERSWAVFAGLGWIGKNTLLIHPKYGSYLLLGEVLINQETGCAPALLPDYCGHCRKCLDACPTQAFPEPRSLNSNRCISYWTLEKRGALEISEQDRRSIQSWVAGCDFCQEVCPFNSKRHREENLLQKNGFFPGGWRELLLETEEEYRSRVNHSALKRVKPAQFSRNLAIALANAISRKPEDFDHLVPLIWKKSETETDPATKVEWSRCLALLTLRNESRRAQQEPDLRT